jgi:hypothetical protein
MGLDLYLRELNDRRGIACRRVNVFLMRNGREFCKNWVKTSRKRGVNDNGKH